MMEEQKCSVAVLSIENVSLARESVASCQQLSNSHGSGLAMTL